MQASSGWVDSNWAWNDHYDWRFGAPLALAVRTGHYTWERRFESANVSINTEAGSGVVNLASGHVLQTPGFDVHHRNSEA